MTRPRNDMTDEELTGLLAKALVNALHLEKTNTYVMFGIQYADFLDSAARTQRIVTLCRQLHPEAMASKSCPTDINYGLKLAPYVEFKDGHPPSGIT